jgi:hypothetical protein
MSKTLYAFFLNSHLSFKTSMSMYVFHLVHIILTVWGYRTDHTQKRWFRHSATYVLNHTSYARLYEVRMWFRDGTFRGSQILCMPSTWSKVKCDFQLQTNNINSFFSYVFFRTYLVLTVFEYQAHIYCFGLKCTDLLQIDRRNVTPHFAGFFPDICWKLFPNMWVC